MNCVESEFEAIRNTELVENVMTMVFHRLFADEKLFADFAVAETLGYELNDLFLSFTQERLFAALAGLRGLLKRIDHFGGHAVVEPDLTVENLADTFHQQVAG